MLLMDYVKPPLVLVYGGARVNAAFYWADGISSDIMM